jgi:hypothetical protein
MMTASELEFDSLTGWIGPHNYGPDCAMVASPEPRACSHAQNTDRCWRGAGEMAGAKVV